MYINIAIGNSNFQHRCDQPSKATTSALTAKKLNILRKAFAYSDGVEPTGEFLKMMGLSQHILDQAAKLVVTIFIDVLKIRMVFSPESPALAKIITMMCFYIWYIATRLLY